MILVFGKLPPEPALSIFALLQTAFFSLLRQLSLQCYQLQHVLAIHISFISLKQRKEIFNPADFEKNTKFHLYLRSQIY